MSHQPYQLAIKGRNGTSWAPRRVTGRVSPWHADSDLDREARLRYRRSKAAKGKDSGVIPTVSTDGHAQGQCGSTLLMPRWGLGYGSNPLRGDGTRSSHQGLTSGGLS
eukprot:1969797-Rhodomonas_salina.1